MATQLPHYQIELTALERYDWRASVVSVHTNPPQRVTITAKSLAELLTKVTVNVAIHESRQAETPLPTAGLITPAKN